VLNIGDEPDPTPSKVRVRAHRISSVRLLEICRAINESELLSDTARSDACTRPPAPLRASARARLRSRRCHAPSSTARRARSIARRRSLSSTVRRSASPPVRSPCAEACRQPSASLAAHTPPARVRSHRSPRLIRRRCAPPQLVTPRPPSLRARRGSARRARPRRRLPLGTGVPAVEATLLSASGATISASA
jgi:hypothetical protein